MSSEPLGGYSEVELPDGFASSTSWERATEQEIDVSPVNRVEWMVRVGGGALHRVVFALKDGHPVGECDCLGCKNRGWCAHVAAMKVIDDVRAVAHGYYERTGYPVQVIVDEAHRHLPDSEKKSSAKNNTLAAMLHEDRDKGVKIVLASQDPTDFYYPPLKQCKWLVWCGPPSTFHRGFRRYYSIDVDDLPDERFQYVVIRPSDPPRVVYQGETNEVYA